MPSTQNLYPECGNDFVQKRNLDRHIRSVHVVQGFPCEHCGKLFNRSDNLAKHKCTEPDNIQCEKCEKRFSKKSNLKKHMKTHMNELAGPILWMHEGEKIN